MVLLNKLESVCAVGRGGEAYLGNSVEVVPKSQSGCYGEVRLTARRGGHYTEVSGPDVAKSEVGRREEPSYECEVS